MGRIIVLGLALVSAGCWASARPVLGDESEKKADEGKADPTKAVGAPFKLPEDAAGRLLGTVLPPTRRMGMLENPSRPAPSPAAVPVLPGLDPAWPEQPTPAPRLGPIKRQAMKPRTVALEGVEEGFSEPILPSRPAFDTLGRTRDDSADARQPPPLPALALRPDDRVPLEDPTLEASGVSVLEGAMPERSKPVPYLRASVPEPFEFRTPLLLPLPEERASPQGASPVRPEKPKL